MTRSPDPGNRLQAIMAHKREEIAARRRDVPLATWEARLDDAPPIRPFREALVQGAPGVIAEFKRRSPSAGRIAASQAEPAAVAQAYAQAGAKALSVLTDARYFAGCLADLREARAACKLPVLRKDFVVDAYQLVEARAAGADAVLLIADALEAAEMDDLHAQARSLHLDVLVEVHSEAALQRVPAGANLVGVNHRDLRTFTIDHKAGLRLLPFVRQAFPTALAVAESGLESGDQARHLADGGFQAFLVGSAFLTGGQPGRSCAAFVQALQ